MSHTTHLFWTGGWDSTFRLLQLLFEEKRVVQPHYLMRSEQSSGTEIDTMVRIRRNINRNYPEYRSLLKPIIITDSSAIKSNERISKEYQSLIKEKKVNTQYETLARYCSEMKITNAELSVIAIEQEIIDSDLFESFAFPLLRMTKKEMLLIAKENGWMEIMKMTSFCRRPKNGRPCGFCGPCTDAVMAGMGWRLPLRARIIANLQLPFRKWWRNNYQNQSKGFLGYIPKLLKGKF